MSLRCITNTASKLPGDFGGVILAWLRFNRRNSQLRKGEQALALEDTANQERLAIGRYHLQNICNMDQTPIPYEFLEGKTYNLIGEKTVWFQSSKSGWDKRQGTLQLTIFADGVPCVKPLIFFRGRGSGPL